VSNLLVGAPQYYQAVVFSRCP